MPKKLLLADDSITIQKVISITFASEDFAITVVGDGDSAIKKAKEIKPDVILADVAMPAKSGYEVCSAIKSDPALKNTPVMLLAGTFEPLNKAEAAKVKADDSIVKPFESQELIDKVKNLLAKAPAAPVVEEPVEEAAYGAGPEIISAEPALETFGEEIMLGEEAPEEEVAAYAAEVQAAQPQQPAEEPASFMDLEFGEEELKPQAPPPRPVAPQRPVAPPPAPPRPAAPPPRPVAPPPAPPRPAAPPPRPVAPPPAPPRPAAPPPRPVAPPPAPPRPAAPPPRPVAPPPAPPRPAAPTPRPVAPPPAPPRPAAPTPRPIAPPPAPPRPAAPTPRPVAPPPPPPRPVAPPPMDEDVFTFGEPEEGPSFEPFKAEPAPEEPSENFWAQSAESVSAPVAEAYQPEPVQPEQPSDIWQMEEPAPAPVEQAPQIEEAPPVEEAPVPEEAAPAEAQEPSFALRDAQKPMVEQVVGKAVKQAAGRVAQEAAQRLSGVSGYAKEQVEQTIERIAREVIEEIAWEVVPELAEEILAAEIGKFKQGWSKAR